MAEITSMFNALSESDKQDVKSVEAESSRTFDQATHSFDSTASVESMPLSQDRQLLAFFEVPGVDSWTEDKCYAKSRDAINLSQGVTAALIKDLNANKNLWLRIDKLTPLFTQLHFTEAMKTSKASLFLTVSTSAVDPRKLLLVIAKRIDSRTSDEKQSMLISDRVDTHLLIHVDGVFNTGCTPLIALNYATQLDSTMSATQRVKATTQEIEMLINFLNHNSATTQKINHRTIATMKGFERSFILPISKLTPADKQLLTQDTSCSVCNALHGLQCKKCLTVRYCGRVCQVADWPSHKLICRPIDSQQFFEFKTDQDDVSTTVLNLHAVAKNIDQGLAIGEIEQCDKRFIIKAQCNDLESMIMVYDKKRRLTFMVNNG